MCAGASHGAPRRHSRDAGDLALALAHARGDLTLAAVTRAMGGMAGHPGDEMDARERMASAIHWDGAGARDAPCLASHWLGRLRAAKEHLRRLAGQARVAIGDVRDDDIHLVSLDDLEEGVTKAEAWLEHEG